MNKKDLNERDICSKFITPAIQNAGWDTHTQIREEVRFTKGRIIVRGKLVTRGKDKRADYILYYKPNIPIAIVEAKDNLHRWARASSRASTTQPPPASPSSSPPTATASSSTTRPSKEGEGDIEKEPPDPIWP